MRRFRELIQGFLRREDGPTVVEYAVMLALIIIVCLAAVAIIGTRTRENFNVIPLGDALTGT